MNVKSPIAIPTAAECRIEAEFRRKFVTLAQQMVFDPPEDDATLSYIQEMHARAAVLGIEQPKTLGHRSMEIWPETRSMSWPETARHVLMQAAVELLPDLEAFAAAASAIDASHQRQVLYDHAERLGLALGGQYHEITLADVFDELWPETSGSDWVEAVNFVQRAVGARALRPNTDDVGDGLASRKVDSAVSPQPAGYADVHAEMLGVTPAQYRAARAKLATRRSRRIAFANRTEAVRGEVEVDLTMSRGCPRTKPIGRDLPYEPEEN